ncbi:hypothetical protein [Actinoplanes rectilineatus]|uniref:hypothetical protein n=1 Tax=Actinoplanes rectilineatus TaxID=113571 RepID=UPI000A70DD54|nr:hypothetical protein [Actinoplanes rectilineatus]
MDRTSLVFWFGQARTTAATVAAAGTAYPGVVWRSRHPGERPPPAACAVTFAEVVRGTLAGVPGRVTVVHPACWGPADRAEVTRAAASAGLPMPVFVSTPVAVAHGVGAELLKGRAAAVLVLDGSAVEIAAITRTRTGFSIAGDPGELTADPRTPDGRMRICAQVGATVAGSGVDRVVRAYLAGAGAEVVLRDLAGPGSAHPDLEPVVLHGAVLAANPPRGVGRRRLLGAAAASVAVAAAVPFVTLPRDAGPRFVAAVPVPSPPPGPGPVVYAFSSESGRLSAVDTGAGVVTELGRAGGGTGAFGLTPDARTAVLESADGVRLFDVIAGRVRRTAGVPRLLGTVVAADGSRVYALQAAGAKGQAKIHTVDVATGDRTGGAVDLGRNGGELVAAPDGRTLYALEFAVTEVDRGVERVTAPARLTVVDTASGRVRMRQELPAGTSAVVPGPDGVYVLATDTVTGFDVAAGRLGEPVRLPGRPTALDVTPDGRTLFVLCERETVDGFRVDVVPVDRAGGTVRTGFAVPGAERAHAIGIAPGGRRAYLAGSALGWFDVAGEVAGPPVEVGGEVSQIGFSGTDVYVLATGERSEDRRSALTVVDSVTGRASAPIRLPTGPARIAVPGGVLDSPTVSSPSATSSTAAPAPASGGSASPETGSDRPRAGN